MNPENHPRLSKILVGHKKQIKEFNTIFENKKLHHAWIFEGEVGIGKATFAYFLAKTILTNSTNFIDSEKNFKEDNNVLLNQIKNNVHPDLKIIDSTTVDNKTDSNLSFIPVSKVREIEEFYAMKSTFNGWKICIIDSLDKLNIYGLNALLKILEEPPKKSLIIIISNKNSNVLATLRSRCSLLRFLPLEHNQSRNLLQDIIKDVDTEILDKLLILSEGSPGKALEIHNNQGLELYDKIIDLFLNLPRVSIESIESISNILNTKTLKNELNIFKTLLTIFLSRSFKLNLNLIDKHISNNEKEAQINSLKKINANNLSTFWDVVCDNINEAIIYNLDKKQIVLETTNILKSQLTNKENFVISNNGN